MADNTGDPHLIAILGKITPYLPGVAGAIFGAAWGKGLNAWGRVFNFGVGMFSAGLLTPVVLDIGRPMAPWLFPRSMDGLLGFACGFFGMALFGGLYQAVAKYSGDPLKIIKFEAGPLRIGGAGGEG